jgi:hypothetical protein
MNAWRRECHNVTKRLFVHSMHPVAIIYDCFVQRDQIKFRPRYNVSKKNLIKIIFDFFEAFGHSVENLQRSQKMVDVINFGSKGWTKRNRSL